MKKNPVPRPVAARPLALALLGGALAAVPALLHAQTDTVRTGSSYEIGEAVVTGTRNAVSARDLPMTVSVVGRSRLEASHNASLLPTLTQQVPGLFVTSRGVMGYGVSTGAAGGMSLRGLSSSAQMLVLIDGHPQYMGLFGHPIADAYQTMLADRVEVLRGPASVLYGSNAMAGVINIVTRRMPDDGVSTDATVSGGSYGTVQAEAANRVKHGRFSSVVTANYGRSDGHRPDMAFEQYGGYAKLAYDWSPRWRLWGDVNVTHFNASNPGPVDAPLYDNDSRITRGMASAMLENHYERTSGAVSLFYNWGRHEINDGYEAGEEPQTSLFHSKDYMAGVSLYQSFVPVAGGRLTLGFDYQHFGGETWNRVLSTGERLPGVEKKQDELAGYADYRQHLGRWLTLDAGLRVDHHSHTGTEFIPQGGLSFHLPRQVELKAMVSKGFRNPTIREMYMFPPQNPDLRPERLMNYELSFSQRQLDGALTYGLNLYYIKGENIIEVDPAARRYFNSGAVENYGLEASVAYTPTRSWNFSANYSWVHMETPVLGAPEHKLYAGADYHRGAWRASTGVQYVRGLYTAVGSAPQRETFVLWDAQADYRLCRQVTLFVKGENLLAQRYETLAGYPMPKATFTGGVSLRF